MKQDDIKEFLDKMSEPDVVRKVEYPVFDMSSGKERMKIGISFIDDINVTISVELGKATMKIRDIINLDEGSVLELEQPAGETAEVLINGQKFGRGEVIVIGGNFGIRMDSIYKLEKKDGRDS